MHSAMEIHMHLKSLKPKGLTKSNLLDFRILQILNTQLLLCIYNKRIHNFSVKINSMYLTDEMNY